MQDNLFKAGDNTILRFFEKADQNNFVSEQEGRPCYDTVLYAEVITPGSNESAPEVEIRRTFCKEYKHDGEGRFVRNSRYYSRYAEQVKAYDNKNGEHAVDGMPIEKWPLVDVGVAQTLRSRNVYTVEQLAEVADSALHNLGTGGRTLRDQAKAYVTARQFGVPIAQQTAENTELKTEVERLKAENDALKQQIAAMASAKEAEQAQEKQPETVL